ncbi:hypothetical protein IW262DRAFT_495442 [Armillaria fumosa]|nr:hypothetical protein IW262DRAFT_495442 [Armillaria fumosa]
MFILHPLSNWRLHQSEIEHCVVFPPDLIPSSELRERYHLRCGIDYAHVKRRADMVGEGWLNNYRIRRKERRRCSNGFVDPLLFIVRHPCGLFLSMKDERLRGTFSPRNYILERESRVRGGSSCTRCRSTRLRHLHQSTMVNESKATLGALARSAPIAITCTIPVHFRVSVGTSATITTVSSFPLSGLAIRFQRVVFLRRLLPSSELGERHHLCYEHGLCEDETM